MDACVHRIGNIRVAVGPTDDAREHWWALAVSGLRGICLRRTFVQCLSLKLSKENEIMYHRSINELELA